MTEKIKDNKRLRKEMKMKKLFEKWLKSEAYKEYCINLARLYNYGATI